MRVVKTRITSPRWPPRASSLWLPAAVAGMLVLSACAGSYGAATIPREIDANAETAIDRARATNYNYVDVDFIQQTREVTCGLAAFASVARMWGVEVSQNDEYMAFPPLDAIRGYSVEELKQVIESRGFSVSAVRGDDAFLREQIEEGRPVIVPLRKVRYQFRPEARTSAKRIRRIATSPDVEDNLDHFVVVVGYGAGGYLIVDPDDGFAVVEGSLFNALRVPHQGAALIVAPGSDANGEARLRASHPEPKPRQVLGAENSLAAVERASDVELEAMAAGRQ